MLKKAERINKYTKIENNKYFAVSLNYVFSYLIYYIDLCTLENGNKKYYFCKNDENQFINALGIFNSFNDMINCLESLNSLNSSTSNFFEGFDFSNYNENDIVEVNNNTIIYHGDELDEFESFDFKWYLDTFEYIFVHAIDYTSDANKKYIKKSVPLDDENFSRRPTVDRILFFNKDKVTTAIDVDAVNEEIRIKNFIDINIFRAFGVNEKPNWQEYLEFLEDRCTPRTRYNIKEILRDLGLDCYDVEEYVKKTHARSYDDRQWMSFEKEMKFDECEPLDISNNNDKYEKMNYKVIIDVDCDDFEIFKSDLCQSIKKMNPVEAINQIKESGCIELLLNKNEDVKALYLVAMVNYLSNKYNLDMNIHDYDNYTLEHMVYPRSVLFKCAIMKDDKYKQEAIKHAEKEFLQFNICEGEIERVA